jgi:hypothetical protein
VTTGDFRSLFKLQAMKNGSNILAVPHVNGGDIAL